MSTIGPGFKYSASDVRGISIKKNIIGLGIIGVYHVVISNLKRTTITNCSVNTTIYYYIYSK